MSIEKRREREKQAMVDLILSAALDIAKKEGFSQISIRKIAGQIDYSPSIIYHYFKDKDDIIGQLMQNGYGKILKAVSSISISSDDPLVRLKESSRNYIRTALAMSDEYMAAQLNQSEHALEYTSYLFMGAAQKKGALSVLLQNLKELNRDLVGSRLELMAQTIAVATFGLILKLIIEKVGAEQQDRLIDHFVNDALVKLAKE